MFALCIVLLVSVIAMFCGILACKRYLGRIPQGETASRIRIPIPRCYAAALEILQTPTERVQIKLLPRYTPSGLKKTRLPNHLRRRLSDFWKKFRTTGRVEPCTAIIAGRTTLVSVAENDPALLRDLERAVKALLLDWLGFPDLQHTASYGIRTYRRGAALGYHVDRLRTHAFSAIIHVAHDPEGVAGCWSLGAWDHTEKLHLVTFDDHDVLLYESATVIHGRPWPLQAESYSNLFIHFKTTAWFDHVDRVQRAVKK